MELLIVVVIIAILAAITVAAYNGVQGRAQDSIRLSDMKNIQKSLERYRLENGTYPAVTVSGSGVVGDYERSALEAPGEFIAPLKNYGFPSGVPLDPVNSSATVTYAYYRYSASRASLYGCPTIKPFYVLGITYTNVTKTAKHPDSPGFSCASRNWQSEFSWVMGAYEE